MPCTSRKRATRAELEILDKQIRNVLEEDHPQSVRHVFYRMTDPRLDYPVPKTETGYKQVQRECLKLRRAGRVPYRWINDATRHGYFTYTYDDSAEFIESMAGLYRQNIWMDKGLPHVEVWCESRSIGGVLVDECRRLAVPLYPSGGFSSASFCYGAAEYMHDIGRDSVALYVGDYDPAGVLIDQSIEKELRQHLDDLGAHLSFNFLRLAINADQIRFYNLPTKPRKATDRRRLDIKETVEAEAMPAATLRKLVRNAVEGYLPEGALEVARLAEEHEKEMLLGAAGMLERRKKGLFDKIRR